MQMIDNEKQSGVVVLPPEHEVFTAFNLTPFDSVKVVIIGQDPYHGMNQAHGLAFSVRHGIPPPPSLKNIFLGTLFSLFQIFLSYFLSSVELSSFWFQLLFFFVTFSDVVERLGRLELASDPDVYPSFKIPSHGNLEKWARQGVLLLNAVLTVQQHIPNSHANKGLYLHDFSMFIS
jgi:uracil-DNA glycosylase